MLTTSDTFLKLSQSGTTEEHFRSDMRNPINASNAAKIALCIKYQRRGLDTGEELLPRIERALKMNAKGAIQEVDLQDKITDTYLTLMDQYNENLSDEQGNIRNPIQISYTDSGGNTEIIDVASPAPFLGLTSKRRIYDVHRDVKKQRERIQHSIDQPLGDDDGASTFADIISGQEDTYQSVEDSIDVLDYQNDVLKIQDFNELGKMPFNDLVKIIKKLYAQCSFYHFYHNLSLSKEVSESERSQEYLPQELQSSDYVLRGQSPRDKAKETEFLLGKYVQHPREGRYGEPGASSAEYTPILKEKENFIDPEIEMLFHPTNKNEEQRNRLLLVKRYTALRTFKYFLDNYIYRPVEKSSKQMKERIREEEAVREYGVDEPGLVREQPKVSKPINIILQFGSIRKIMLNYFFNANQDRYYFMFYSLQNMLCGPLIGSGGGQDLGREVSRRLESEGYESYYEAQGVGVVDAHVRAFLRTAIMFSYIEYYKATIKQKLAQEQKNPKLLDDASYKFEELKKINEQAMQMGLPSLAEKLGISEDTPTMFPVIKYEIDLSKKYIDVKTHGSSVAPVIMLLQDYMNTMLSGKSVDRMYSEGKLHTKNRAGEIVPLIPEPWGKYGIHIAVPLGEFGGEEGQYILQKATLLDKLLDKINTKTGITPSYYGESAPAGEEELPQEEPVSAEPEDENRNVISINQGNYITKYSYQKKNKFSNFNIKSKFKIIK